MNSYPNHYLAWLYPLRVILTVLRNLRVIGDEKYRWKKLLLLCSVPLSNICCLSINIYKYFLLFYMYQQLFNGLFIFSSPGQRPCELLASLCVRLPLTFSKIFSSEQILLKLGSNDLWHVGYKDSSFRIDRTKNMAAVAKKGPWGSNSSCSYITWKLKQLSKFRGILGRSARQDLSAVQFSWRSVNRCRSYWPFNVVFF